MSVSLIRYSILWPGGNTTAVVTTVIPRDKQSTLAKKIMADNPAIEQVGYLEKPTLPGSTFRLQMMGGEFCANAARSAAFLWHKQHGDWLVSFEVSGFPEMITADFSDHAPLLKLPGKFLRGAERHNSEFIVDLFGIRHIVTKEKDERRQTDLLAAFKSDYPAVGVTYVENTPIGTKILPVIWVRGTNTCIKESACGSGSIAAAIAMYSSTPEINNYSIIQPSGEIYAIKIHTENNIITTIDLAGVIEYRGETVTTTE